MFPTIKIGIFSLPLFQLCIFLGLIAYIITVICITEKKEKVERKTVNQILVASALGIAALYIFAFVLNSIFHSIKNEKITIGGITWLGGILFALPITAVLLHIFCTRKKGYALTYLNLIIPALVIAHAFGRIGCFFGGCCYGKITGGFLGISFPPHSLAAHSQAAEGLIQHGEWSLPVYPTQLFEAAFELLLFTAMLIFYKRLKNHFVETYCFSYGIFRFILEFYRGDNRGSVGFALSPSQVMSALLIILGVLLLLYHKNCIFKKLKIQVRNWQSETERYGIHVSTTVRSSIKKLEELKNCGCITDEEYAHMKKLLDERIAVYQKKNKD